MEFTFVDSVVVTDLDELLADLGDAIVFHWAGLGVRKILKGFWIKIFGFW